jgi:hypothetical protein
METALKTVRDMMFAAIAAAVLAACATCFADGPFDTRVDIAQANAIVAKSAKVEQLTDRVALFIEGEEPQRQLGLRISVKSTAKFVAVRAIIVGQGRPIPVYRLTGGDYLLFGKPGIYAITVIESDPDKGLNFTDVESTIVGSTPVEPVDPIDPVEPDQPSNPDLATLERISREFATKLNDPKTAKALSESYKKSAADIETITTIEAAKSVVQAARRQVLLSRTGASLAVDWNSWLQAIEPELSKHLGSVKAYQNAVSTVAKSLDL